MLKVCRNLKVVLCVVLIVCMLITNDQNVVNAIQQNSYSYLSQGLKRPDLISYNEAKAKKHIRRLTEKEDEYTFVFENIDGTLTSYTYGTKVQVKDNSGELQEIDLDVKEEKNKAGKVTGYKQTGNGYNAEFPSELTEEAGIRLETEDSYITMTPLRSGVVKAQSSRAAVGRVKDYNGKVAYKNVFDEGADIELYTTLTGVKEDIVLKKAPKSNIFEFLITAPNLSPTVTDTGAVEFYDPETLALRFRIPETYAKDSYSGPRVEGDGHYTEDIKVSMTPTDNGEWIYRLELEEEFLFGKNTVYPVTIDPTMLSLTGAANQDDAYVNSANPNTNYNPNTFMCVGRDSTLLACRTYVKYVLTNLLSKDALAITSAEYRVYEHAGYTSNCTVRIYRVEDSWSSSTITWNIQDDFDRYSISSLNVNGAGWYYFNVTSMVNSWYLNAKGGGGYANNGFAMISDQESSLLYRRFYSSESSTSPPYLVMDYSYVDRTAPNPPTNLQTGYIKHPNADGTAKITASWTAATDLPNPGGSGIKHYIVELKNASGALVEPATVISSPSLNYVSYVYHDDLANYTVSVRAVDKAKEVNGTYINNTSTVVSKSVYVPDCKKPAESNSLLTPSSSTSAPTNATSLTLGWIVSDESSLSKMEYWIGAGSHSIYTNPAKTDSRVVSISGLSTGSYTLYYQFTDTYGNASSVSNKSFTVDRTQPSIYSMFSTNIVGDSFLLPLTFTDNYVLDEAVLEYGIGTSPSVYTQISTETLSDIYDTWNPEISTEGWTEDQYYTIRAKVKDKAGNWNNTFTRIVIKSGEGITIPAALIVDPVPETITTPTVQISHNRQTSMYTDVLINGTNFGYFSANSAISVPVNKPDLAEGQPVDLVIRSNVYYMAPAEYNVDRQQRAYIHEMSSNADLTLTNTVIDSVNGVLKL
ncbi:DNRLRE domain-containing protein, partial [Candidatus Nomurabacteria bacterium]|nr:DNRLRE domain-containing protein [Candidatus Nomurabacteria bacterium]